MASSLTGHRRNVKSPVPPGHGLCHARFQDNEFLQAGSLKRAPLHTLHSCSVSEADIIENILVCKSTVTGKAHFMHCRTWKSSLWAREPKQKIGHYLISVKYSLQLISFHWSVIPSSVLYSITLTESNMISHFTVQHRAPQGPFELKRLVT